MKYDWIGDKLSVKVLYSKGSVANHTLLKLNETGDYILIDCADGILRDLIDAKIDLNKISAIFFSHEHFDHIGGIYSLFGYFWYINRINNINIYFPSCCKTIRKIFNILLENYKDRNLFYPNIEQLHSGNIVQFKGVNVEVFPAYHPCDVKTTNPLVKSGLMYKFSKNSESIIYTGDTGYRKNLDNIIIGTDLALIEATYTKKSESDPDWHMDKAEATKLGKLAKNYILIHKR